VDDGDARAAAVHGDGEQHDHPVLGGGRAAFHPTPGEVITIAASAGGHLAAVERFAVTGARIG
jgi:hypothetical protein